MIHSLNKQWYLNFFIFFPENIIRRISECCSVLLKHTFYIGYEPADLTVHPPPPELPRVGSFFSYRCQVFPIKCPQMKA